MKKVISITIVIAVLSSIFTSCEKSLFAIRGEGEIVTQTLNLTDFDAVNLAGAFDVEVSYGDEFEVIAEGHQNIIDRLETSNNSGNLRIKLQNGNYKDYYLKLFITVPDINEVGLSGSGDIIVNKFDNLNVLKLYISGSGNIISTDYVDVETIYFEITGSGDIDFATNCQTCSTEIIGSGDVKIKGTTDVQNIDISGSGDFHCFNFISENTNINISGSGDCQVYANNYLGINLSGSGDIQYKGYPQISSNISGSGSVQNKN